MHLMHITTFAFLLVLMASPSYSQTGLSTAVATDQVCGSLGSSRLRTTLYFGLKRKSGRVTENEWRGFLQKEVTARFPEGLTVWEATGQWRQPDGRIVHERSKVLLLVHDETPSVRATV